MRNLILEAMQKDREAYELQLAEIDLQIASFSYAEDTSEETLERVKEAACNYYRKLKKINKSLENET